MYRVLIARRFFHAVFATVGTEQLDPLKCEHVSMDVYDWHHDLAVSCNGALQYGHQT